jgi:hypothetical protein
VSERLGPAGRAKLVLDIMPVEQIGRQIALPLVEGELLRREKGEQKALSAAMRAVARHGLAWRIRIDRECDRPAMATTGKWHGPVLREYSPMCSFYVQFRAMQASIGRMRRDQIADRHRSIL